ncbi:MAG: Gfo/Idh/MocA family oxidoreductase [Lentisphaerae bacterium]|jgi:predicted dehydrogenase|nr:Gfo/Idh/MocA family oxidoreductase [Lentisphaerota bacterium]MBT4822816.1 Gfo/Idh/MocA family oxidoreductase [Lentisphaerota bacterium]MBT5611443.1 Gfo/Idh/MocA family oxidoreductase [Lentisphaerota bacterium]MBT7059672.1 Gfo/Idh/MocA family oxidoreductase [Lentisphaerota bacterium]MBT7846900.1 Gfo/Idh/MocA family oxidoreductase [Lentisphaerota bacterium]
MKRRELLQRTVQGAVGVYVGHGLSLMGQDLPPSEKITMACIGVGGRGRGNLNAFLNDPRVRIIAVCDVDRRRAKTAADAVSAFYAKQTKAGVTSPCICTADFREIMARPDVDAVMVGTPDHTHALISVSAMRSGKDVYCEKPLAYSVAEGRLVVQTAETYGRVLQTGTQRRSNGRIRHACELVRNGRIGSLKAVRVGLPKGFQIRNGSHAGNQAEEPVPDWFDYDKWLGPAPNAPYTPGRCHFNFRWILDYGEGYISDWGAHYVDVAHWGMGADTTGPRSVEADAIFPDDGLYDAPTEFHIEYAYPGDVLLACSTREVLGIKFEGSEGWIHVEKPGVGAVAASDPGLLTSVIRPNEIHLYESTSHARNFIDCVVSREATAAPPEVGHRSASACHVGMIAARLAKSLTWNAEAEAFVDNPTADRLLARTPRAGWAL